MKKITVLFLFLGLLTLIFSCSTDEKVGRTDESSSTADGPPKSPPNMPESTEYGDDVYKVVEHMPLFGGCETKQCSDHAIMGYIIENLKYPIEAREANVQGRVFVRFVINENGKVSDAQIVRDIGAGCGKAALDVVEAMNDLEVGWQPGKQTGEKVKVLYTLPFSFK